MRDLNTEEQFIHDMNNKLFSLFGKIQAVKSIVTEEEALTEVEKLEKCYKDAESVLLEYKAYIIQ